MAGQGAHGSMMPSGGGAPHSADLLSQTRKSVMMMMSSQDNGYDEEIVYTGKMGIGPPEPPKESLAPGQNVTQY